MNLISAYTETFYPKKAGKISPVFKDIGISPVGSSFWGYQAEKTAISGIGSGMSKYIPSFGTTAKAGAAGAVGIGLYSLLPGSSKKSDLITPGGFDFSKVPPGSIFNLPENLYPGTGSIFGDLGAGAGKGIGDIGSGIGQGAGIAIPIAVVGIIALAVLSKRKGEKTK